MNLHLLGVQNDNGAPDSDQYSYNEKNIASFLVFPKVTYIYELYAYKIQGYLNDVKDNIYGYEVEAHCVIFSQLKVIRVVERQLQNKNKAYEKIHEHALAILFSMLNQSISILYGLMENYWI